MLRVTIREGGDCRALNLAPGESARVGSGPDNDLVAPFVGVSRRHARLEAAREGVLVADLGSKNGLLCDGRRYENLLVVPGRRVLLGRAVLEVEVVSAEDLVVALELDAPERRGAGPAPEGPATGETRALRELETASPAPALRLVRQLSRPGSAADLPAVLDRARTILGARWLTILEVDRHTGELSTGAWSGPAAGSEELDPLEATLASEPPGRGDLVRVELPSGLAVASRPDGRGWLAAAFPPSHRPEPWAEELLAFLAERLLEPASGEPDGEPVEPPRAGRPGPSTSPAAPLSCAVPTGEGDLDFPPGMVVGPSAAIQDLLRQLRATVKSDLPVLLTGETGVGKELVARLIHRSSPKSAGPFVAINCAAIPGELLEAELFGVAARVATGVDPRPGLFPTAHGGTLFLDEIGDMPERLQVKLLRVLQEREVWPVGRSHPEPVDVRVLAASNRDLAAEVETGRFRRDLYYRLRGLHVHVPPLRQRRDDLPALIHHLASRAAGKYDKHVVGVTRPALSALMEHPWPGNVRELEHEVERAVLLCPHGGALEAAHFPGLEEGTAGEDDGLDATLDVGPPGAAPGKAPGGRASPAGRADTDAVPRTGGPPEEGLREEGPREEGEPAPFRPLQERLDEVETEAIREALARSGGVKARAARLLGVTRNGLALKMKRLGLEPDGAAGDGQGDVAPGPASG